MGLPTVGGYPDAGVLCISRRRPTRARLLTWRDTARPDSDVDLLVEFEPEQKSLEHLVALGDLLESVLGRHVELVTAEGLSPFLRPHILADAMDVVRAA